MLQNYCISKYLIIYTLIYLLLYVLIELASYFKGFQYSVNHVSKKTVYSLHINITSCILIPSYFFQIFATYPNIKFC